ncbi:MAG: nucleotidyltransferase domain-containing protein [Cyanobacteria bacterium P01_H01_bin.121]
MARFTDSQMQAYIATAQARAVQRKLRLEERRQQALAIADQAAQLLKEQYSVSKVVLFGSVLSPENFNEHSDLDLAVWDLPEAQYFEAVGKLLGLSSFAVDLVPMQHASAYMQVAIAEGIEL